MANNLSAKALAAMTDANGSTGKIHESAGEDVIRELRAAGMIGTGGGLTRTGRIVRERHVESEMDRLFG
jgi:hypothetical protein